MKKIYKLSLMAAMILGFALPSFAQRVVVVEGWDPAAGGNPDDFNNALADAVAADTTGREENPNTIYELKRGHVYQQGKMIKNYDFALHVRAEEGEGPLPQLVVGLKTDGTYGEDFFRSYNDLILENIYISCYRPDGGWLNRCLEARGFKQRLVIKGCYFDGDRGSGITVRADSMKVYVENTVIGNCGYRKAIGGNGRYIDLRPEAVTVDSIVIKNGTVNNVTDRIIRNMGAKVNYLEFDHVTVLNNYGYHGALQLGYVKTAKVTNCIFANPIGFGHVDSRTGEQTQPEKHFSVISLDTIFEGQTIEVRNNNIYNDQALLDVWAKYDTVSAPWPVTPTVEVAVGTEKAGAIYFEEPLSFTTACGPKTDYIDAYFMDPQAAEYPDAWCVGGDGGYFLDEMDLSYATTTNSYTAADEGFPLGNLNYFPELKAIWDEGGSVNTGISDQKAGKINMNIYPNPVNGGNLTVELNSAGNSIVTILDITGQTLLQKSFNERIINLNVNMLNRGLYIIKVDNQNDTFAKRLVIE